MMATYGLLYYSTFSDSENNRYKLEIQQLNYTGSSTQVKLAVAPVINYPDITKGYDWLFTSGIEFELLSETDRQYISLVTNDIQKYRLILKGIYSGYYYPIWTGFLDTENYEESANENYNYNVRFTGNDGFKLLERFNYVDTNGNNYTGITSIWQVIVNCLSKIYWNTDTLFYTNINKSTNIYVNDSTTGATFNPYDNYTTLHKFFIQNENFIDEDGVAMNCYDVLNAVLQSFNLYLFQDCTNSYLYLVDDITYSVSGNTQQFYKIYSTSDWSSYDNVTEMLYNIDINTDDTINNYPAYIRATNGIFSSVTGIKSQKINYSQYASNELVNYSCNEDDLSDLSEIVSYATSSTNYKWQEYRYNNSEYWNKTTKGSFCKYVGNGVANSNVSDYYFKLNENEFGYVSIPSKVFTQKYKLPYLNFATNQYKLKLVASAYFRTKDTPDDPEESSEAIYCVRTRLFVEVGNTRYCTTGYERWDETPANDGFEITFYATPTLDTTVCDNWVTNTRYYNKYTELKEGHYIPLNADLNGDLTISFTDYIYAWNGDITVPANQKIIDKDVRFKSLSVYIVDNEGNEISLDDIVYDGYIDEKYRSKGEEIKNIIGTNFNSLPLAKGSLYEYNGSKYVNVNNIHNSRIYLSGETFYFDSSENNLLEKLAINNILNQYSTDKYGLTHTTTLLPFMHASITYNKQYPNKRFFLIGLKNNYNDSTSQIKLIEYDNN